jgi:glutamyl endopeptidase
MRLNTISKLLPGYGARAAATIVAAAALAATTVGTATATPPTSPPDSAHSAGNVTLVNGAGRTVSVPQTALAALGRSAGTASYVPAGAKPATTKTEPAGGVSADSVIPPDGRVQEGSTTVYPWGAIAHIELNTGGCSGFLLSRDTLVTAGHCVYDGGWATSYTVYPGRNGVNVKPYGSCSGGSGDLWTNTTWVSTGSSDYDYGMIKLTCDIGYSTGWFGWWYNEGESLVGQYFYVEGFPGDKPYGTMWWDGDTIASQTARRIFHNIDTFAGESGSPLYRYRLSSEGLCAGWCITGIHTTGFPPGSTNGATRFNAEVMGIINYVIGLP